MNKTQKRSSTILKKRYARKYLIDYCTKLGKNSKFTNIQMLQFLHGLDLIDITPTGKKASELTLKFYESRKI